MNILKPVVIGVLAYSLLRGKRSAMKQAVKVAQKLGGLALYYGPENLSENYTLTDFTDSATALNEGINNAVYTVRNLATGILLAQNVLEPINQRAGVVYGPSSWYRCPELNLVISKNETGKHTTGGAFDVRGDKLAFLSAAVDTDSPEWDRLLIEGNKNQPYAVHIEYNPDLSAEDQRGIIMHLPDGKSGNEITLQAAQNLYL